MTGITLEDFSVFYGSREAITKVSGSFPSGKLTFILGPNGSGKSTLLRALGGAIPFRGKAGIGGRDLSALPPRRRGRLIGVAGQSPGLNSSFTVEEIIAMGRLPYRKFPGGRDAGAKAAVERAVRAMELEGLLLRPASTLSGGERQRTLIAQVIAQDPEVFLLDEPSSALDPRHTVALFRFLRRAAAEGKTAVAAVHDINLAAAFGDFVWLLDGGGIAASGRAEEVLTEEILTRVYGVSFVPLKSEEGGRVMWRAV